VAYPTRERTSSVAPSFRHRLHAGHPVRKGVVTIDALRFTDGLCVERLVPSAALGAMQFVRGPAARFPLRC
jgi:hypothetical protein